MIFSTIKSLIIAASVLLLFSLLGGPLRAQEVLTLDAAVAQALNANYGIQVARNNARIAENSAHPGAAGLLPAVTLSGNANYNNNNATAELITGTDPNTGAPILVENSINGLQTSSAGGSLGVAYTVFDGLGNVYRYRVLKSQAALTQEQTRAVIEATLAQVMLGYYQLGRQTLAYALQEQSLARSQARLAQVRNQAQFGSATGLAVLNARVDLQADSIALAQAALLRDNARRDLNALLGQDIEARYEVETLLQLRGDLDWEVLAQYVRENNAELLAAQEARQAAELNLRVAQSGRYPRLSLNASYGYNYANNGPISFARTIESVGLAAGATLSFNIFNGNQVSRNIQNAEVSLANSRLQYRETEQNLIRDLRKAHATYRHNLKVLDLSQARLEAARLNFARTRDAYDLGQATGLAFREAQLNLFNAEIQLNNARFDVKVNEVELMRLSGLLLPEGE